MAGYRILIKASAAKEIDRIEPKALRRQVIARIEALRDDPRPRGCEKLTGRTEHYRVRQGAWRVVYRVDDDQVVVMVIKVGLRKDVYEGL